MGEDGVTFRVSGPLSKAGYTGYNRRCRYLHMGTGLLTLLCRLLTC